MTIIARIAGTIALDAIAQGLTAEALKPGWGLTEADLDYARERLGRELDEEERVDLVRAFERAVRDAVGYRGHRIVPVARATRFLPGVADYETRWVIVGRDRGQAWPSLERAMEEVDMVIREAEILSRESL